MGAILEVRNLRKQYGGLTALSDVSFGVEEGEIVGLIGPNGAGKTTTFNLLTGFEAPTAGSIHFRGHPLRGLKPYAICRRGIARTFQIVKPLPRLTVLENVMVGSYCRHRDTRRARAVAAEEATFVGLGHLLARPASALTLAERKRLELARALATGPSLLLLDEVMAGLNPTETEAAIALLRSLQARGIAMVVVEHVMQVIMTLSERVVVLVQGQCVAVGAPAVVANDPQVVAAYLGSSGA